MINILRRGDSSVQAVAIGPGWRPEPDVLWIDLLRPSREEELAVEAALGLQLPTVEEMEALEPSSRLYQEDGATFMTASNSGTFHGMTAATTPSGSLRTTTGPNMPARVSSRA